MKSSSNVVVCTLFEGNYHVGVGALTNSLYVNGFRGLVYAGFRGELPTWAKNAEKQSVGKWTTASVLKVADGLELAFLPLETNYHLTNFKPAFMLELLDGPAANSDAIFYFDPDIVVNERWTFFEEWVSCGVALCEDINSPLPENHPRRVGWRNYFCSSEITLNYKNIEYVNGGFLGVMQTNRIFLEKWKLLIEKIFAQIGGPNYAGVPGGQKLSNVTGFANCFSQPDQDALNACLEACDVAFSVIGQEAMGLKPGFAVVPHSIGRRKPWNANYLLDSLCGRPPGLVDKLFWRYVSSPLLVTTKSLATQKRIELSLGSLLSRFIRRS